MAQKACHRLYLCIKVSCKIVLISEIYVYLLTYLLLRMCYFLVYGKKDRVAARHL